MSTLRTIRASSLPRLVACPSYVGDGETTEGMLDGTERHILLHELLDPEFEGFHTVPESQHDNVWRAANYILGIAGSQKLFIEEDLKHEFDAYGGSVLTGHPDVWCCDATDGTLHVFDLKWRETDYTPQLLAYAYLIVNCYQLQACLKRVNLHTVFANSGRASCIDLDKTQFFLAVEVMIKRLDSGAETLNPHCADCARAFSCNAARAAVSGFIESPGPDMAAVYYSLDKILSIFAGSLNAIPAIEKWIEEVKSSSKKLLQDGVEIPDYRLQERKGSEFITDVHQFVARLFDKGITSWRVAINACTLSKTKAVELIANNEFGMTKKAAEDKFREIGGELIGTGKPTFAVVRESKLKTEKI